MSPTAFTKPPCGTTHKKITNQAIVSTLILMFREKDMTGYQWEIDAFNKANSDRALQWRHDGGDGAPNHRRRQCLFNHLFRRRSKKTSKLRVNGLCEGYPYGWQMDSPHRGPVTPKMFPFNDVIMKRIRLYVGKHVSQIKMNALWCAAISQKWIYMKCKKNQTYLYYLRYLKQNKLRRQQQVVQIS